MPEHLYPSHQRPRWSGKEKLEPRPPVTQNRAPVIQLRLSHLGTLSGLFSRLVTHYYTISVLSLDVVHSKTKIHIRVQAPALQNPIVIV